MHDAAKCPVPADRLRTGARHRGRPHLLLRHQVLDADGGERHGPGRHRSRSRWAPTVSASRASSARIIEAFHDEKGIVWPGPVARSASALVNLRADDAACGASPRLYSRCRRRGVDVLLDDTEERAGAKFATMDLIGIPWQVTSGRAASKEDRAELKKRRTGERYD